MNKRCFLALFFFFIYSVPGLAEGMESNKVVQEFSFIKNSLVQAIEGDIEAFPEIPVQKLLSFLKSDIKIETGKNLEVEINGRKYHKAFVNYSERKPMEIHIDELHWPSVIKSSNVLCIVLHEYLSLLKEEDFLYELSGDSRLCLRLKFATVNFVWQNITTDQPRIDVLFRSELMKRSRKELKGDPYDKFRSYFPLESPVNRFFLAYGNIQSQSQLRSQLICMKHLCERFTENRCANPQGFQEEKMLCPYWQEFPSAFNAQCESIGLKAWCDFSDHTCDNSAFVRQSVYFSCIGPLSSETND